MISFRSNSCTQILPFKTDTCLFCKKLQKSNKSETENTCTVDNTKQDIQSIQQVTVEKVGTHICCFLYQYSHEDYCTKDLNTSGQCRCSTDAHLDASQYLYC
jgi:hypothetical protein